MGRNRKTSEIRTSDRNFVSLTFSSVPDSDSSMSGILESDIFVLLFEGLDNGVAWMEVITTHLNADFDAFASMVAAKKLFPEALVAFSGSQGKNVRDFFIESTLYILSIERAKDIDLNRIQRLILVDTRQKSRIGRFAAIADSESVDVHIYDHHPSSDDDVKGNAELIEEVGATVTLLIREIRSRGVELNAEEATILALGIYEDTGSFTFPSTTREDLEGAAGLAPVSRGKSEHHFQHDDKRSQHGSN